MKKKAVCHQQERGCGCLEEKLGLVGKLEHGHTVDAVYHHTPTQEAVTRSTVKSLHSDTAKLRHQQQVNYHKTAKMFGVKTASRHQQKQCCVGGVQN